MVGNGNDANGIALQPVNQGIRKAMKGKRTGLVHTAVTQRWKLSQQSEGSFNLVDEVVRRNERAFVDIPVDGGIGIGLRLFTKTDWRHFLRRGLWCEAGS